MSTYSCVKCRKVDVIKNPEPLKTQWFYGQWIHDGKGAKCTYCENKFYVQLVPLFPI